MGGLVQGRKRPSMALSEDDESSDIPSSASSSKRVRSGRDASAEIGLSPGPNGFHNGSQVSDVVGETDEYAEEAHRPGSLVRVKLSNFVTYTAADFNLGPSLNMVIGPNGTGKSTLVCAICLGLGWDAKNLGRAKDVGEFVKHGAAEATIEIELAASEEHHTNPVVKRIIRKEGNKSAFFINGRPSNQKEVVRLAKSFNIQIDNLCQFLPQDRVVEFAGLSPVALLKETLRAAAPEQMVAWHEELIELRMNEKRIEAEQTAEDAALKQLNNRQNATREDVERWHQRQEFLTKSKNLERCRPIIETNLLMKEYTALKQERKAAERELVQLNADAAPARRAQEEMAAYRETVKSVRNQRNMSLEKVKKRAEKHVADMKAEQTKIADVASQIQGEREGEKQRRQELKRLEGVIANIDRSIAEEPVEVDEVGYRQRRAEFQERKMNGMRQMRELKDEVDGIGRKATELRQLVQRKTNERALLDTQSGQQANLLKSVSPDTYRGWDWIQQNRDKLQLKGEIHGPPILTCSVEDPRYADMVESQIASLGDATAITFTNGDDQRQISEALLGANGLRLHQVTFRVIRQPLAYYRSPVTREELQELGFEGWALDHIHGPEPVLAMLCEYAHMHRTAYSSNRLSAQQHDAVINSPISSWIAGPDKFRVTKRREYGMSSTRVSAVTKARFFTDQPVDNEKKHQLETEILQAKDAVAELKKRHDAGAEQLAKLRDEQHELKTQIEALDDEHRRVQRARAQWEALPQKKAEKQEELDQIMTHMRETAHRVLQAKAKSEQAAIKLAALALEYQKTVSELRQCHEGLVEAEIRLVEAISEVESLDAEYAHITEAIAALENNVAQVRHREQDVKNQLKAVRDRATRLLRTLSEEDRAAIHEYSQLGTIEELNNEIEAVNTRLNLMAEGNPHAVQAFENREKEIEAKQQRLEQLAHELQTTRGQIGAIRGEWEPRLDELVAKISDGFAHNFAQIGCAGQVGVHKDDDFEKWSIQIQVRFRENEALSILDSQRQSGGERAVSTIFYLMALQDLARSPFRVVDEINQGMDPRNERMVHERMVDIACRERTSQYFLITPKLLSDLKFHPKMKIHCIASGEHMPAGGYEKLDFGRLADIAVRRKMGVA